MIDCILIDGLYLDDPNKLIEFKNFIYFLSKHLLNLLDIKEFQSIKILTSNNIEDDYRINHIEYFHINRMSLNDYQNFSIFKLYDWCPNDFLMTCQIDGWPVHFDLWKDSFLDYDFIGAPWSRALIKKHFKEFYHTDSEDLGVSLDMEKIPVRYMVGNSGFCIRSKKFLDVSKKSSFPYHICPIHGDHFCVNPKFDDWFFGIANRNFFEFRGIKYAPPDIASQFSTECSVTSLAPLQGFAPYYYYDKISDDYQVQFLSPEECLNNKVSFGMHGRNILLKLLENKQ